MKVEEDLGGSGRVSLDLIGQVGFVMWWDAKCPQRLVFPANVQDPVQFLLQMFNVPSKLTKNLLQADELVDMVWIWIDAQERLRKVARCKIGQVQSFSQMMKPFYIPDIWLAYARFEITSYLKDTSLRLEEPLWRSPGPMTICLKQLFVVRELFRSDWNIQPCVIQINKKHNIL